LIVVEDRWEVEKLITRFNVIERASKTSVLWANKGFDGKDFPADKDSLS
jgi:hypothetical protein